MIDCSDLELIDLADVDKALAQSSLFEFVRQAWHLVEPGTDFVDGEHIQAICLHLEAVSRRQVRNLLINIPPRCCKSLLVSVFWPCWAWVNDPQSRWLFASYNQNLAIRDAVRSRRIIESNWFQSRWGHLFQLTSDQNAKARYENNQTGYRIATSVGGSATGEGADFLVTDDPHSVMDAFSDAAMKTAVDWFAEAWSTRLNDPKTGCKVVIMQRVSEKDVSGYIEKKGGWDHLKLPMRYESEFRCKTSIGWEDWRTAEGDLLWPHRLGETEVSQLETDLGSYGAAAQLQQRPSPRGGGMFKRQWFEVVKAVPVEEVVATVRYWDRAGTQDDGDWTVGLKMVKTRRGLYYVTDIVRLQGSPMNVEKAICNTASADGSGVHVILEQDPGQAGKMEVGYHIRQLAGYVVRAVPTSKDKETRAAPSAAQSEAGNIKILDRPWTTSLLDELSLFPKGKNDDQVDCFGGAFNELCNGRRIFLA